MTLKYLLFSPLLGGGTHVSSLQNKMPVALDCQPPLAGWLSHTDEHPRAEGAQHFLPAGLCLTAVWCPCPESLSNPTPAERPVADLPWLPPPGAQRSDGDREYPELEVIPKDH